MQPLDLLAAMPQFVRTDAPRTLYNVLSNCVVAEHRDGPGLVLRSGAFETALEGLALEKYLTAADMQATLLLAARRG